LPVLSQIFTVAEKGWDDELGYPASALEFLRWTQFTCRTHLALRIMCMSSMLAMVDAADRNDLNPSIGRATR